MGKHSETRESYKTRKKEMRNWERRKGGGEEKSKATR